jgi:hypothetical protein
MWGTPALGSQIGLRHGWYRNRHSRSRDHPEGVLTLVLQTPACTIEKPARVKNCCVVPASKWLQYIGAPKKSSSRSSGLSPLPNVPNNTPPGRSHRRIRPRTSAWSSRRTWMSDQNAAIASKTAALNSSYDISARMNAPPGTRSRARRSCVAETSTPMTRARCAIRRHDASPATQVEDKTAIWNKTEATIQEPPIVRLVRTRIRAVRCVPFANPVIACCDDSVWVLGWPLWLAVCAHRVMLLRPLGAVGGARYCLSELPSSFAIRPRTDDRASGTVSSDCSRRPVRTIRQRPSC